MKDFSGRLAVVTGGGSFVAGDRDEWERTFGVCQDRWRILVGGADADA